MADWIHINPADNVAVALRDLKKGITAEGVELAQDIPAGHKFTLAQLHEGDDVIKYGFPIGCVTRDVPQGSLVDHNCIRTKLSGVLEYSYEPALQDIPAAEKRRTFRGFRRADGNIGIRNQIWVIPTVGCVNGIAQEIARRLREEKAGHLPKAFSLWGAVADGKISFTLPVLLPH